jgi:hypothetical protein
LEINAALGDSKSIILDEDETKKSSSTGKQNIKAIEMTPASASQFTEGSHLYSIWSC